MLEESIEKAASTLKLPKDVVLGEVLVSFLGRHSVVIENYRSIILYTDNFIKLQAKNCRVNITGSRLMIEYYTNEEMKINGFIKSLEFE
ncbi:YabP/YqfC family sporulation protein [Lacrimispora algidixylanolytica]|jgi:sporulation protein YqfC|uniref:Sporulation protein n=1 Tax=Lacrimispora algidixylanolytica TaxID=94868 RepID=A0A419SSR2_9FIRM|nr:YabP/YqfC family sporulation protein [Lacrimispora algidixylanolytica]RKD28248.1 sporulation protein [Lacrimispora algidixylanolytica]